MFRVYAFGLKFRDRGLGLIMQGSTFRNGSSGFMILGSNSRISFGYMISGSRLRDNDLGFMIRDSGLRVWGSSVEIFFECLGCVWLMVGVCLPKEQHVAHCVFAVDDLGKG